MTMNKPDARGSNAYYRISGNFREYLIFAIFANDLKTRKFVSVKNCTLKESLEVGTGILLHTLSYLKSRRKSRNHLV